jgi:hypothetical protein
LTRDRPCAVLSNGACHLAAAETLFTGTTGLQAVIDLEISVEASIEAAALRVLGYGGD